MRDRNNSVDIGGDSSGPIIQAEKYVEDHGQWPVVTIAVAAIVALALIVLVVLRDDVTGRAVGTETTTPRDAATPADTTPSDTTSPDTTTPTETTSPDATTPAETTRPAGPAPFRKLHSERRSIRRTNVDVDPPQPSNEAGAVYTLDYLPAVGGGPPTTADLYAGGYPPTAPNRIAQWTNGGVPDGEQCADHLRRMGTNKVSLAINGVYCVASPLGRIVVLSEITFTDDDAFGLVTVWSR